ncbi:MAG: hypothetical protein KA144_11930 [Xanthomonadaceae bacterium]|nr:hypothetical protein [Xanthomonadaceae bacterium]
MRHPDNPFGTFKDDAPRLEAVRLRERRRLWLGLASMCAVTLICLFSDQPANIASSLGLIVQALMR